MTVPESLHLLAQISASQLLNSIAQGTAIAFFAWAVLRLVPRQSAVTRFAVWFSALVAIAVLPVVGLLSSAGGVARVRAASALTLPSSWAIYLFMVWGAIAAAALLKLVVGLARLVMLRRACEVMQPESLDPVLQQTLREFGTARSATVCKSDSLNVPAAIGFFKPTVVFPSWAMEELSAQELNSILLHELAHLARWDDWTNLAQKFLRSVFFFHPAVWWIESKLSLEREMACDDIVLARTSNPRAYAECLVSLTEKGLLHRGLALVQAAIGRVRQTTLRVTEILDKKRSRTTRVYKPVLSLLGGFSVMCLAVSPHAPTLVSFASPAPGTTLSAAANPTAVLPRDFKDLDRNREMQAIHAAMVTSTAYHAANHSRRHKAATQPPRTSLTVRRPDLARTVPAQFATQQAVVAPAIVLVVMRDGSYNANGQMLFTVSVYRFTARHPGDDRGINPKKI